MELLNVWLTVTEIGTLLLGAQVQIEHNAHCNECGESTEIEIQIQKK